MSRVGGISDNREERDCTPGRPPGRNSAVPPLVTLGSPGYDGARNPRRPLSKAIHGYRSPRPAFCAQHREPDCGLYHLVLRRDLRRRRLRHRVRGLRHLGGGPVRPRPNLRARGERADRRCHRLACHMVLRPVLARGAAPAPGARGGRAQALDPRQFPRRPDGRAGASRAGVAILHMRPDAKLLMLWRLQSGGFQ